MAYEIRPRSVGEILDTGFRLLRDHFGLLVSLSALAYVPFGILLLAQIFFNGLDKERMAALVIPFLMVFVLTCLIAVVTVPLSELAMTMALGELYLGRPMSVGAALRQSWPLLLPVLGTRLLVGLFIGIALLLLIIPGIWLMFSYWLVTPVMGLEHLFGMNALDRSGELMGKHKGRAFVIAVALAAMVMAVTAGATWALSAWPLIKGLASTAVGLVGFALFSAVNVVFYFDVRCRHEAFDLEHLAQLVEQPAAAAAAID